MSESLIAARGHVDIVALTRAARSIGCEIVTKELIEDIKRTTGRLSDAEHQLRAVAALRIVAEREDWRGRLTRRWIRQTQAALDYFRAGCEL